MGVPVLKSIATGYNPRHHQQILHMALIRFNVIVCHRRFGKTVFSLNEMIDKALRNERKNPQYAYLAPYYGQAKRVAWDYLKEYTRSIPGMNPNEAELKIEIPRPHYGDKIKIILLGADNPGAIRGMYFDGVILDEYAEMDPTVWSQVIRPALSDRLGWAIFIGTPKGRNHFHDIYEAAKKSPSWYTAMYRASETKIIPASELEAARMTMSEEEYEQEYECSFAAALVGAYYGKQMAEAEKATRITTVPYDRFVPVKCYWDLGTSDMTSIWFIQKVNREYHAIDYLEDAGRGLEDYVKELKAKPYVYGGMVLPHDAQARELGSGKTRVETMRSFWPGMRITVLPRHDLADGIHMARMMIGQTWFDKTKCDKGIQCLKNYERKWDAKNKIYLEIPRHNWASHGADAFRYFAEGEKLGDEVDPKKLKRVADNDYDIFGGFNE